MAHLKTQDTSRRPRERMTWKLQIVRGLYERGYTRRDILELFRVIDWMMTLPPQLDRAFHHSLQRYEGEKARPYVTSIERKAIEQGREEGREEARENLRRSILSALLVRFERVPDGIKELLGSIVSDEALLQLYLDVHQAATMEEFQQKLAVPGT